MDFVLGLSALSDIVKILTIFRLVKNDGQNPLEKVACDLLIFERKVPLTLYFE